MVAWGYEDPPLPRWPILDALPSHACGQLHGSNSDDLIPTARTDNVIARVASIREQIMQVREGKEALLAQKNLELEQLRRLVAKKNKKIARLRKSAGFDEADSTSADSESQCGTTTGEDDSWLMPTSCDDACSQTSTPTLTNGGDDDASSQATLLLHPPLGVNSNHLARNPLRCVVAVAPPSLELGECHTAYPQRSSRALITGPCAPVCSPPLPHLLALVTTDALPSRQRSPGRRLHGSPVFSPRAISPIRSLDSSISHSNEEPSLERAKGSALLHSRPVLPCGSFLPSARNTPVFSSRGACSQLPSAPKICSSPLGLTRSPIYADSKTSYSQYSLTQSTPVLTHRELHREPRLPARLIGELG